MQTITTTEDLAAFCARAAEAEYVTVDTEFLRERTYYSKLCLIQLALPSRGEDDAVLVDPIDGQDMSLEPLYDLFRDPSVVKVFHAARQDLEIFYVDAGLIPDPLFDTQVAAMVCGFGEQVGYETLVRKIAKQSLDKTSRFTDWSRRPLTDAQKTYAVADVTHLRDIYEFLAAKLAKSGRDKWVAEEMQVLTNPETYVTRPDEAWQRVKTRNSSGRFLAIVRELARFREDYAQSRNIPRNRVFKDDALVELASTKPKSANDLSRSRLLLREARRGDIADGIIAAVKAGLDCPNDDLPKADRSRERLQINPALADLLRVLLKAKSEEYSVASSSSPRRPTSMPSRRANATCRLWAAGGAMCSGMMRCGSATARSHWPPAADRLWRSTYDASAARTEGVQLAAHADLVDLFQVVVAQERAHPHLAGALRAHRHLDRLIGVQRVFHDAIDRTVLADRQQAHVERALALGQAGHAHDGARGQRLDHHAGHLIDKAAIIDLDLGTAAEDARALRDRGVPAHDHLGIFILDQRVAGLPIAGRTALAGIGGVHDRGGPAVAEPVARVGAGIAPAAARRQRHA